MRRLALLVAFWTVVVLFSHFSSFPFFLFFSFDQSSAPFPLDTTVSLTRKRANFIYLFFYSLIKIGLTIFASLLLIVFLFFFTFGNRF